MKFSIRFADQIVGTLVILALAILVFVIFMLGRSQRWFTRDLQYKTYFNSASGISNNMAIQYKGFTIGHVKKIELTENDTVEVTLSIFEEHSQRVKEGSLVEVSVSPIGLGNSFIFYPGKGRDLIPEGMEIPEKNSDKAKLIIATGMVDIPEAGDGISSIINNVNAIIETIKVSLNGSEVTGEPNLEQIISNVKDITAGLTNLSQTLSDQISPILGNLQTVTDQISDPSGTVMSVLGSDGSLSTSLTSAIESLAGIIDNLDKTSAFIPAQLPQVGVLISDLNGALRTAQDVLTSVANNPLLKGGIPEYKETGPGAASPRDMEF
ncbi:MAG: MlaD family protein [Treponema sp.]|jgi:phospholipid/cholesterol/gamma-HCH transport system substrate-binding protein|nr:MlaD family protein [Treponema sp.]